MISKKVLVSSAFLLTMGLAGLAIFGFKSKKTEKGPNLIYMFSDQHRLHALGIWSDPKYKDYLSTKGDPVVTPNLDQMARDGVLFTQMTSTHPVCSPHRAMLMSGMFPDYNGIKGGNSAKGRAQGLRHDIKCISDVLYDEGYETAYFGKAHWERNEALFDDAKNYVGTTEKPGGFSAYGQDTYVPPGPGRHSNKYWLQALGHDKNPDLFSSDPALVGGKKDGEMYRAKGFKPVIETNAIVDYIKNTRDQRDASKPFSIIWSTHPPHTPYESVKDTDERIYNKYYKDKSLKELAVRDNYHRSDKRGYNKKKEVTSDTNIPIYFSHVTVVDQQVGRIMAAIEEMGEADNTILVFSSDHGDMMGSHKLMRKNYMYDESFLVPFIVRYPKIKPYVEDLLMATVDVMPTILGMMGLGDKIPNTVQGVNYSKGLMAGNFKEVSKPISAPYLHGQEKGVKTDNYTYLVSRKGKLEIYNTKTDPYQMKKLDESEVPKTDLKLLKSELGTWLSKAGDPWAEQKKFPNWITYPKTVDQPVSGIAVVPPHRYTLAKSEKKSLKLKYKLAPANAKNKKVKWMSENEKVAKVNASGVVTAIAPGEAAIKVMSEDGNYTARVVVNVTNN